MFIVKMEGFAGFVGLMFGRSDFISFCRDAGFRVQLRFCVGSAGKPVAGPSGFFAREGNIVFRGG